MKLHGEFIRADGLAIPNNITKFGAEYILRAALRNEAASFWVGLVNGVPDTLLQIQDLEEPTIGFNGYSRKQIAHSTAGWPTVGDVNDYPYCESDWLTWAASPGNFSRAIQRLVLMTSETALTGSVIAISSALPAAVTIGPTTAEINRRFKYRLYLR